MRKGPILFGVGVVAATLGAYTVVPAAASVAPTVSVAFAGTRSPNVPVTTPSVPLAGTDTKTITITNPDTTTTDTNVAFTDTLPSGLGAVASSASTNCSGGTATNTSTTVSLSGASLAPSSNCHVTATISGAAFGSWVNSVQVTSTQGTSNTASATLEVTGGGGPLAQSVLGSGSDTTQFMMYALSQLYTFSPGCAQIPTPSGPTAWLDFSCQGTDPAGTLTTENYQHDQVPQAYFLGSSNGIKQLENQGTSGTAHIDYARSSRAPKTTDNHGLHFVAYARDGIAWEAFNTSAPLSGVHNMDNDVAGTCATSSGATAICMSQSQLQGIYLSCTITNWSQVGGNNVAIDQYTAQPGSGTRSTFDTFLGGSSDICINKRGVAYANSHIIPENSNTPIIANGDANKAIFAFSWGVWTNQVHGGNSSVLGALDNFSPTFNTIQNGAYPWGRFLYNVFNPKTASAPTVQLVGEEGWICKTDTAVPGSTTLTGHGINPVTGNNYLVDIQNAIKASGFVPLVKGTINGGDTNQDYCRLIVS